MSGPPLRALRPVRLLGVLVVAALLLLALGSGAGRSGLDAMRSGRSTAANSPTSAAVTPARVRQGTALRVAAAPATERVGSAATVSHVVRTPRTAPVPGPASAGLLPDRRGPPAASFVVVLPERSPTVHPATSPSPGPARAPPLPA